MNDWAQDAAKRLQAQRDNEQLKREVFVEKQRLKRSRAPLLWGAIKRRIADNCAGFNAEFEHPMLSVEEAPHDRMLVKALIDEIPRALRISFDEAGASLGWGCEGRFGRWEIEITNDGIAQFTGEFGPASVNTIADEMLNALVLKS